MGSNPFEDRLRVPAHGQKSEKKTAKRLAGRATPGSGSLEGAKGDIVLVKFLVENKATEKASFSLKRQWLEKISKEARAAGKNPALSFQFVDKRGHSLPYGRWVCIPEDEFRELTE